ncbi:MAG: hypothetical protein ACKPKO_65850 [Candidatus Fonsibacter sp.]
MVSSESTTETTTTLAKKASECEHCKKTFSSVSALRRHQAKNLKCKLLQATETLEKFKLNGTHNRISSGRGVSPLPDHMHIRRVHETGYDASPIGVSRTPIG